MNSFEVLGGEAETHSFVKDTLPSFKKVQLHYVIQSFSKFSLIIFAAFILGSDT